MSFNQKIASSLLEIEAISFQIDPPFRYTSGILSPIYTDNRLTMSYPKIRQNIAQELAKTIQQQKLALDVIAGTATAGIPHAAWLADKLNLPMIYVRGKTKKHGKKNKIEGILEKGQKVMVVEDLISTGGSALDAVEAVREKGGECNTIVSIFTYEMEKSKQALEEKNVQLFSLLTFSDLVEVAIEEKYLQKEDREIVLQWAKDPMEWTLERDPNFKLA